MAINDYKNKGVIYKLTSPSNKVYIGQSINVEHRHYMYKRKDCKDQSKLYNAINKYGFENFNIEIIFEIDMNENTIDILNEMESKFITEYDSVNTGYNCRSGGLNSIHSEDTIKKMKIIKNNLSESTHKKMSNSAKIRKYSKEGLIKMSNCQKKPIIQLSINNEFISN